jgi:hypothetical protein
MPDLAGGVIDLAGAATRQAEREAASERQRTLVLLVLAGVVVPGVGLLPAAVPAWLARASAAAPEVAW